MTTSVQRGYQSGCIGWLVQTHAAYYSRHAGFGLAFEAKVASELSEFCLRYDERKDGLWLASVSGALVGSIAIDGPANGESLAHLRWFIVSEVTRGTGLGRVLLATAITFCRERVFKGIKLWTFEGLDEARHLYEDFGFKLAEQRAGQQWGTEVLEQRFELTFQCPPSA